MLIKIGWPELVTLIGFAFLAYACGRISRRLGYSAWWGLLIMLPLVGPFIWAYYVAFASWPITARRD